MQLLMFWTRTRVACWARKILLGLDNWRSTAGLFYVTLRQRMALWICADTLRVMRLEVLSRKGRMLAAGSHFRDIFGSREFLDAYAAALADQCQDPPARKQAGEGTFAALAARYFASPKFLALSPSSPTGHRRAIERFLRDHGHRRVGPDAA